MRRGVNPIGAAEPRGASKRRFSKSRAAAWILMAIAAGLTPGFGETAARAQFGTPAADPFQSYFGFFLPRQQYLNSRPTALDNLNQVARERGESRLSSVRRSELFDPLSPMGLEGLGAELDLFGTDARARRERRARILSYNGIMSTNTNGQGVPGYFSSVGRYYPMVRPGQFANANAGSVGGTRGLGMGMGNFGIGMPSARR